MTYGPANLHITDINSVVVIFLYVVDLARSLIVQSLILSDNRIFYTTKYGFFSWAAYTT